MNASRQCIGGGGGNGGVITITGGHVTITGGNVTGVVEAAYKNDFRELPPPTGIPDPTSAAAWLWSYVGWGYVVSRRKS